jgi:hypothetical protein
MIRTSFREDEQRKRAHHAAKNFAIVRKIGLNLLKKGFSCKSCVFRKKGNLAGLKREAAVQYFEWFYTV